jgi:nucleoside-diphosphate-sugar epimerase
MRIFVAGASGAIGQPLIAELLRRGHEVTGMTRSEAGARNLAGTSSK